MLNQPELPRSLPEAMTIIEDAKAATGTMSAEEQNRICAEVAKFGGTVVVEEGEAEPSATTRSGWVIDEVTIHPFVERYADEDGDPVDDGYCCNASGGDYSDEFGDDLDGYPDEMFRKGWSVTSWERGPDRSCDIEEVDDKEFPDYQSAIAYAQQLSQKYRVEIDHRY